MQCALASSAMGEHGDCSVRAVALTTNVPYETAHVALRVAGRRNRRGAFENQIVKATRSLGYTVDPKVIPKQSNGSLYTAKTIGRVVMVIQHPRSKSTQYKLSSDVFCGCSSIEYWISQ